MTSDAERLAPWIREMPLSAQISITGATLLLADIKAGNGDAFADLDEVRIRESETPAQSREYAASLAARWRDSAEPDARRVVSLCEMVVKEIDATY